MARVIKIKRKPPPNPGPLERNPESPESKPLPLEPKQESTGNFGSLEGRLVPGKPKLERPTRNSEFFWGRPDALQHWPVPQRRKSTAPGRKMELIKCTPDFSGVEKKKTKPGTETAPSREDKKLAVRRLLEDVEMLQAACALVHMSRGLYPDGRMPCV